MERFVLFMIYIWMYVKYQEEFPEKQCFVVELVLWRDILIVSSAVKSFKQENDVNLPLFNTYYLVGTINDTQV